MSILKQSPFQFHFQNALNQNSDYNIQKSISYMDVAIKKKRKRKHCAWQQCAWQQKRHPLVSFTVCIQFTWFLVLLREYQALFQSGFEVVWMWYPQLMLSCTAFLLMLTVVLFCLSVWQLVVLVVQMRLGCLHLYWGLFEDLIAGVWRQPM